MERFVISVVIRSEGMIYFALFVESIRFVYRVIQQTKTLPRITSLLKSHH